MAELPSGTVTFLFTDLEGSTRLWDEHPEAMRAALVRHDAILSSAVAQHAGHVLKTGGDGVLAVFATAHDGLDAAIDAQRALSAEPWGVTGPLSARMGLHTGEAQERDGDYFGPALNRGARLMSLAHGDQIVVSRAAESILRDDLPDGVELVDLGEHFLRGLSRPEQVFQVTHFELRRVFPPVRSFEHASGNLPKPVTSFVGRHTETDRVEDVMTRARVVTLTGVGGVGKTRLALQVAEAAARDGRFRDGCWLCELAPVRDGDVVADAVAATFGVQPRPGTPVAEALVDYLRGKQLLLLLDNCEHLLRPVAALVARIEQACPGVQILATSREALNVAGEWILGVPSLAVPELGSEVTAIENCEAVQLFVQRARAVQQHFVLDATNADAVAKICRRLDGIALAIELAAARVAALSPAELARRLEDRFGVLGSGQRGAVERHQTLRAAVDWSYDLLSDAEQRLFERLSVFASGFTLTAAEAIASGNGVEPDTVLDLLVSLVSRSLVVADTRVAETRYRLYETIRQYAQERLERRGSAGEVRSSHARYYVRYIEDVAAERRADLDYYRWDDQVEREADNLHVAFLTAVETGDADTALRLLASVTSVRVAGVPPASGSFRTAADQAVALDGARGHPSLPAALAAAAMYANWRGDNELATRHCDAALAAERELGDASDPRIWAARAHIATARGALDEFIECTDRLVELGRANADPAALAAALVFSAWAKTFIGQPDAAVEPADEAVALARRVAAPAVLEHVLILGAHTLADTEPERALELFTEGMAVHEAHAPPGIWGFQATWGIAGHLASRLGDRPAALRYYAAAISGAHHDGVLPLIGPLLRGAADLLAPDDPISAAILHGAGDTGFPSPHRQADHDRAVAQIDAAVGAARRKDLNDQGRLMTLDDAVEFSLSAIARVLGTDPNG